MSAATVTPETPAAAVASDDAQPRRRRNLAGWFGGTVVLGMATMALLAPAIAPYRHTELAGSPLEGPSAAHLLGTNSVGQDVFSQLVLGARASLLIALLAGVGTLLMGALVGLFAGWIGGRTDAILMRVTDVVLALPRLPLLIVVGAYLGPSLPNIALVITLSFWPPGARVVRSQVLSLRRRTHLQATAGFGGGTWHTLRRHVVPEIGLILAAGLVGSAGRAITLEAGLAFLGLGDPTRASWGAIMRDSLDFRAIFRTDAWSWWLIPPVLSLTVLLLGITFLGVALESKVNPRLSRHVGGSR